MSKETFSEDGMECPYCNHVNIPDEACDYDEDTNPQWCGSCGKEFQTACQVSHSWTSTPIKQKDK